jgi:hypothetical protein
MFAPDAAPPCKNRAALGNCAVRLDEVTQTLPGLEKTNSMCKRKKQVFNFV